MRVAQLGQGYAAVFFIDLIIFGNELAHHLRHAQVPFRIVMRRAGDDQRGAGFIDQDVIDLIDNGIVVPALRAFIQPVGQVVAQVVEAKFTVSAVSNIGLVGFTARHNAQLVLVFMGRCFFQVDQEGVAPVLGSGSHLQHAHTHPQQVVDGGHPARVTAGQVIVDGDQVRATPQQGVQIERQGRNQGLAFTSAHFGNLTLVQHHAADHLDIIVTQSKRAFGCLAHCRESLRQEPGQHVLLSPLALLLIADPISGLVNLRAELHRLAAQTVITEPFEILLQPIHLLDDLCNSVYFSFMGIHPQCFCNLCKHKRLSHFREYRFVCVICRPGIQLITA